MSKKEEHTHKYYKTQFKKSKTIIFRCGLANCPHYVPEPLVIGKYSICWRCTDIFLITRRTIRNKKLHCEDCTASKQTVKQVEANNLINEIFSLGGGEQSESSNS